MTFQYFYDAKLISFVTLMIWLILFQIIVISRSTEILIRFKLLVGNVHAHYRQFIGSWDSRKVAHSKPRLFHKSESEKNMTKTLYSISLTHAGSYVWCSVSNECPLKALVIPKLGKIGLCINREFQRYEQCN